MEGVRRSGVQDGRLYRRLRFVVALVLPLCLVGCSFNPFGKSQEAREVRVSTAEDMNALRSDVRRLKEELDNLSVRFDRVSAAQEREIRDLKSAVSTVDTQVSRASESILSEVDRKVAEEDAKRVADKNQLVAKINSLIDRVNDLARKVQARPSSPPRGSETVTEKGFYYTIEEGDSLWGIASKFRDRGVTVDGIRQANNMSSTSTHIVTGQKLFIPVKE